MFKAGDRVHHIGRKQDGTVMPFETTGVVRVKFDGLTYGSESVGEFDENWFNTHPGWLQPLGHPSLPNGQQQNEAT